MSTQLIYPGDVAGCAEVPFAVTDWVRTQEDLAGAEALLRMAAQRYGWKLSGNERGYWPSRSVTKVVLHRLKKLAVVLDESFLDTGVRRYLVVRSSGTPWPVRKDSGFQIVAELSADEARDVDRVRQIVEIEIGPLT